MSKVERCSRVQRQWLADAVKKQFLNHARHTKRGYSITTKDCPLCQHGSEDFFSDKTRKFRHCRNCALIFVPPAYHPSAALEKEEYDRHNNDSADLGYRKFLSRVLLPLEPLLHKGMEGLDFGSGPGPTLHAILEEKGFRMRHYDPFFYNQPTLLESQYDFVTCTEVVEHFHQPAHSWSLLAGLVRKGGYLAIMTLLWDAAIKSDFANWWYKNDATHVAFYATETLQWIAAAYALKLLYVDERTALFKKL